MFGAGPGETHVWPGQVCTRSELCHPRCRVLAASPSQPPALPEVSQVSSALGLSSPGLGQGGWPGQPRGGSCCIDTGSAGERIRTRALSCGPGSTQPSFPRVPAVWAPGGAAAPSTERSPGAELSCHPPAHGGGSARLLWGTKTATSGCRAGKGLPLSLGFRGS